MQLRLWVLVVASLIFYGVSGLEVFFSHFLSLFSGATAPRFYSRKNPKTLGHSRRDHVPMLNLGNVQIFEFHLGQCFRARSTGSRPFLVFPAVSCCQPALAFTPSKLCPIPLTSPMEKLRQIVTYCASSFATFFPHLIAGPIMRYAELPKQLKRATDHANLKPKLSPGSGCCPSACSSKSSLRTSAPPSPQRPLTFASTGNRGRPPHPGRILV